VEQGPGGAQEESIATQPIATPAHSEWRLMNLLTSALLTLLISCGSIAAYHFWVAPPPLKIATIDLRGFIIAQKQALVKGEITEEQFRTNLDRLEQTLKAVPPGELVFIQEVVLRGGKRLEVPVVGQSPTTFQEQGR
jgi:hypothetical protein